MYFFQIVPHFLTSGPPQRVRGMLEWLGPKGVEGLGVQFQTLVFRICYFT